MIIMLINKVALCYGILRVLVTLIIAGFILGVIHLIYKKYDRR